VPVGVAGVLVARPHPLPFDRLLGAFVLVPVARAGTIPLDHQLAHLADRHVAAGAVHELRLVARPAGAARAGAHLPPAVPPGGGRGGGGGAGGGGGGGRGAGGAGAWGAGAGARARVGRTLRSRRAYRGASERPPWGSPWCRTCTAKRRRRPSSSGPARARGSR